MMPIKYSVRSLRVRWASSVMTAMGVALVIMILFLLLGFVAGMRLTMRRAGQGGNSIVVSRGISSEPGSYVTLDQYRIIKARPELAQGADGAALVSPEMVTAFDPEADGPLRVSDFTYLRGVRPIAYQVHRGIRLSAGRLPAAGQPELIVGARLAARFPELTLGRRVQLGRSRWTIVGVFSDGGSSRESEVWGDLDALQQDVHFGSGFSTLHLALRPGAEASFAGALESDPRLRLDATPEERFYALQSEVADRMRGLGLVLAGILGVGVAFGGMNTMYSAVARRTREVGLLRALGFSRGSVLSAFFLESVMLAVLGGIVGEFLGVTVAWATGLSARLMSIEALIFAFTLTPGAFAGGLAAAALIGALGGLPPAWRAARIEIVDSLRAL
ncbi:MAG: ABC transporter permease [Candidatus Binatus sp.]